MENHIRSKNNKTLFSLSTHLTSSSSVSWSRNCALLLDSFPLSYITQLSFVVCFLYVKHFPTRAFSFAERVRAVRQQHFVLFHVAVSQSVVGVLRNCFFVYCDCFTTTISDRKETKRTKWMMF